MSVIVPVRDRARLILDALESVRAQEYRPIELIVVDDGSTDETRAAVEVWGREHSLASFQLVLLSQESEGAQTARNLGVRRCRGAFVQFLDSDDLLEPGKLSRAVRMLGTTDADFHSENYVECDLGTGIELERTRLDLRSRLPVHHLTSNVLNTISPVFRRGFLDVVGPWAPRLRIWQDTEFMFRVLIASRRGSWGPEFGARVRDHKASISNVDHSRSWRRRLAWCKHVERLAAIHGLPMRAVRDNLSRRLATSSRRMVQQGEWGLARLMRGAAQRRAPLWRRCVLHLHWLLLRTAGPRLLGRLGGM